MPPGDASESARYGLNTQVQGNQVDGAAQLAFGTPSVDDGPLMWELAANAGTLDVNSRYAYLLWCRDFADTTVVARDVDRLAGFLTGYRRPQSPDTFFTWQVAVSDDYRRRGLARRMLDHVVGALRPQGVRFVEATVTPDNKASMRLFESFAEANGTNVVVDVLFSERELGSGHEPEMLHRIGPLD
ncbi:diaminobutyrate acetyltransferase [Glycomyces sp. L485]|uniref:diaminobutyrate acetyltransferase n=1 Tax=Glycomyces sp. L485 TaxID=2909235 RepID=UPI001F4B4929|nr:diaminobutyrate acetyltransferase [Glycomyces sp. L485]MCH7231667.1 diaminobutyrate acetyltransferase [Glycomyces sp. L485]